MNVPPGPRGKQVLGFFGRGSFGGTLQFLEHTARQYGPVSSFLILNKRIFVVDDAELIKDILVTRQHEFQRDSGAQLLKELVGDAMITREEPLHRERRRLLQPAFHKEQIASYADIMVRESELFSREWNPGATVNIRNEMRRLTLNIVGTSLFGVDFRSGAAEVAEVLQRTALRSRWLAPLFPFLEPVARTYRRLRPNAPSPVFRRERETLDRIIDPILRTRKQSGTKDMISLLLSARDESGAALSEGDVRNEIVTFVLAGHETTATALTWTWYLLAKHPPVRNQLQSELDTVLGERRATLEDAQSLSYTNMVFQEAMRLYPPALAFARRAKTDLELGGYRVPKGTSIFLSPYITQRNPRYFESPDEFKPERWRSIDIPKFAYFPFGGGAKMCIGDSFAKLEGLLVLATLARYWEPECVDNDDARVGPGLLLNPDKPILMRITSRASKRAIAPDYATQFAT